MKFVRLLAINLILFTLAACSTVPRSTESTPIQSLSKEERIVLAKQFNHWELRGKLALISSKERKSANINWRYSPTTQKLTLTAVLGVEVFSLTTINGKHVLEVDGEEYTSDNLEWLLFDLTGYLLPVSQLHAWLKGVSLDNRDFIQYDANTALPASLTSFHNSREWQVQYSHYKNVGNLPLAHRLTIKQGDLTIKIMINRWHK